MSSLASRCFAAAALLGAVGTSQDPHPTPPATEGMWFVYRHPMDPGFAKRVVRLPDANVLTFFQRLWREAPRDDSVHEWLERELGGRVYGLWSIPQAIAAEDLPMPTSLGELQSMLDEHLYILGDPVEQIRMGEHSLRVLTDDDDHQLAYFFLDDAAILRHPEELSFVVHDRSTLPADAATSGSFETPDELPRLLPSGDGDGFTYAFCSPAFNTNWTEGLESDPAIRVFEGVRLPDLAQHLRSVRPADERAVGWPRQWLALRAVIGEGDDLAAGLRALQQQTGGMVYAFWSRGAELDLAAEHSEAHAAVHELLEGQKARAETSDDQPALDVGEHHAVAFLGGDAGPMILFDDLWASAHPALARSMIRWARGWDPLEAAHLEQLRHFVMVRQNLPGELVGHTEEVATIECPAPTSMCIDGDRLWLADGSWLREFDLDSGTLGAAMELPFSIADLCRVDGRLLALDRNRDVEGRWVVHGIRDDGGVDRPEPVVYAVDGPAAAAVPIGLTAIRGRLYIQQSNGLILGIDASREHVRVISTGVDDFRGLAHIGDELISLSETNLATISVTEQRAVASWHTLPGRPLAFAADDSGFVTAWPGDEAGHCVIRRFLRGPGPVHRVTIVAVAKDGFDPETMDEPELESIHFLVDGERCDDLAALRTRLAGIWQPKSGWPRDTNGDPVEPRLRIGGTGPWYYDDDVCFDVHRSAKEAGFADVQLDS